MNRLLHYELVEQLGEGGMGVVYKARDTRLGRFVAVKVLAAGKASDPDRRLRFAREARAASALAHPNVLTVHEIGSEDGVDFIVTEYVPGKTLAELIPPRGLPAREALRWAVPIADALAATHAAGVIHRDLKPANVMVTDAGLVKILDFGLARFIDPGPMAEGDETEAVLTREGTVFGTCAYMSPEQAEGREVDARSDIFSLGAVLYEMVTGRKAFARDSASATIAAVLRDDPKPACEISGNVPPELDRVIHRCLRKDPAKRFQSMADLRVALEEIQEESDSAASSRVRAAGPLRRTAFGVAAVLVVASAGIWLARRSDPIEAQPSKPVPLTSFGGRILWPALSPDGNQVAFLWNGDPPGSYDLYVKLVSAGTPVRLTNDPDRKSCPAWSPDGRRIAFLRHPKGKRSVLAVIPALGGDEKAVAEAPAFYSGVSWSPDGESLVVSGRTTEETRPTLLIVSAATGRVTRLLLPPAGAVLDVIWPTVSPDGRSLAFVSSSNVYANDIWVLPLAKDLEPAGEPVQVTHEGWTVAQPTWTPDGKRIVFSVGGQGWSSNPGLMVIPASPAPGEKARRLLGGEWGESPTFSAKGSLAFVRPINDLNIWRLPLENGRPGLPARLVASTRQDGGPNFSPDGKRITFSSDRSGSKKLWLCEADGSRPVQLTTMAAEHVSGSSWSPDGKSILFLSNPDGNLDICLTTPGGLEPRRLTFSPAHDTHPTWSRDGAWIYFSSNREDSRQVWRMTPDADAVPVRVTSCGDAWGAYESADGRSLYVVRQRGRDAWSVWKMPVDGGEGTEIVTDLASHWFVDVTATGIYYLTSALPGGQLRYHRFADGSDTPLLTLEKRSGFGLAACPDDSCVLYTTYDVDTTELMYVERFR